MKRIADRKNIISTFIQKVRSERIQKSYYKICAGGYIFDSQNAESRKSTERIWMKFGIVFDYRTRVKALVKVAVT